MNALEYYELAKQSLFAFRYLFSGYQRSATRVVVFYRPVEQKPLDRPENRAANPVDQSTTHLLKVQITSVLFDHGRVFQTLPA